MFSPCYVTARCQERVINVDPMNRWRTINLVIWVEVSAPPGLAFPRSGKVGRHSPSPLSQHISTALPSLLVPNFSIVLPRSRKVCAAVGCSAPIS